MKNPVKFFTSIRSYEVEILKAKLEAENIETYIMNKQDSAYVVIGEIELYIEESDIERAQEIIKV